MCPRPQLMLPQPQCACNRNTAHCMLLIMSMSEGLSHWFGEEAMISLHIYLSIYFSFRFQCNLYYMPQHGEACCRPTPPCFNAYLGGREEM